MHPAKKERTRQEIIQAAKGIVLEHGYEAVTVRRLAEVTGYTHTNLYYYFKDLDSLLWALRMDMIEEMIVELTSGHPAGDDPVDEILDAFSRYAAYYYQHPGVFRFFYFRAFVQPGEDDGSDNLDGRFSQIWQASFGRLIEAGIIRTEDLDTIARSIIYALHGLLMFSFSANGMSDPDSVRNELAKMVRLLFQANSNSAREVS